MTIRFLAILLFLCLSLTGKAYAGVCVENGGTYWGCVKPNGMVWVANDKYYDTLEGAIQGKAADFMSSTSNPERYDMGVQKAPYQYTAYYSCQNPTQETDNAYTNINNPNYGTVYSLAAYDITVHVHGYEPTSACNNAAKYYSNTLVNPIVARPTCPQGYKLMREETGITTFPYGFMCRPNGTTNINSPNSSNSDCADFPTQGCAKTSHPINLATRERSEVVEDLHTVGPWPLSWMRVADQNDIGMSWHIPGRRNLLLVPSTSGSYPGYHKAIITRRNGGALVFKATPVSGGPRTWVVAGASDRNKTTLTEHWSGGGLAKWTLIQPNGTKETYSANGTLLRETRADGQNHHFSYDTSGILTSIRDDYNHVIELSYTNTGLFPNETHYSYPGSGGYSGTTYYSTSIIPLLTSTHPHKVSDGTRNVKYTWSPTWNDSTSASSSLLTKVEHNDGSQIEYLYGEEVEGKTPSGRFRSGVIDEDGQRYLTYKSGGGGLEGKVVKEWRGAGPDGVGALGVIDISGTNKLIDQDGRQFLYSTSGDRQTGFTTPCPDCNGIQAKNLYYSGSTEAYLTEIRDWKNQRTTFSYDAYGRMTERKEAVGTALERTTTWTYPTDSSLREPLTQVEQVKDASGTARLRTTTYIYTDLAATYPSSSPCSGAHGGVSVPCDSTRRLLTAVVVSVNDGSTDRTWAMTYNSYGLMDTMTEPTGQVMKWTWTADGQVATITRAYGTSLARTTTFGGHTNQGPTWRQDASGLYTRWTIDLRGRIVKEDVGIPGSGGIGATDPDGTWPSSLGGTWRSTTLTWRPTGLLAQATTPDGRKLVMGYDGAHRLTTIQGQTASGTVLWTRTLTLSPAGALLSDSTVNGSSTTELSQTRTYNAIRNVATVVDSNSNATTLGYDTNFAQNSVTSPLGNNNSQSFDALGRPTTFTDALSEISTLSYGPQDEVRTATDARSVQTTYAYNGFGDLTQIASPDRGTWNFTYNAAGQQTGSTDPRGVETAQTFDALDRPLAKAWSDAGVVGTPAGFVAGNKTQLLIYDGCTNGQDRLCGFQDDTGTTGYSYNEWGDITGKSWIGATGSAADGITLPTGYGYDAYGRLTSIVYPSGKTLLRAYGSDGEIASVSYAGQDVLENANWTSYGATKGWTWALPGLSSGQTEVSYTYDLDGNPQSITDVDQRAYVKDADQRITAIDDPVDVNKSQVYGYDAMNRITSADIGAWAGALTYSYDEVGNRLSKTDTATSLGKQYSYGTTHNRLTSIAPTTSGVPGTGVSQTYDAIGSLINDGSGLTLSYDVTGRLVSATKLPASASYAYNALGQRVRKSVAGGPAAGQTLFAYDEEGQLLGAYEIDSGVPGGFTVIEELAWLDAWRPVATIRPDASLGMSTPAIHPILTDHLGTPRKILNPSGFTVWDWDAKEPFGNEAPNQNPSSLGVFEFNSRLPGQWFDAETGLHHNGFRSYHPGLGRYVQSDPIGLEAGWNTYGYVSAAVLSFMDPLGLSEKDVNTNIPRIMERSVNRMIGQGQRAYGYGWRSAASNNILKTLGLENYKACTDQSDQVFEDLNKESAALDDNWIFLKNRNPFHHWVIGISSNPNDPILRIDPWNYTITSGRSGYSFSEISEERAQTIRSWQTNPANGK